MQRLQYRNFGSYETLVGTWTVDVLADGDHAAPRWFDLRRTSSEWTVYQEGTHAPDDAHRWLGSTAMDAGGNIALGYNVVDASAGIFPSIRYAARLASEPVGTLQAEATLIAGTGAMTGGLNRWGNYSSTEIDPADGCTFFHTNEYIATTGSLTWQTRVGAFTLSECQLDTYTLYTDPASLAVCRGDDAVFEIAVGSVNGFANSVSFAQTGAPPGISVGFSANPLTPPGSSTMTFTDTAAVAPGTYSLDVFGAAVNPDSPPATLDRSNRLTLIVGDPLTAGPTLQQPPNGAVEISSIPTTFQWDAIAGVAQYTIAIATDAAFTNLVETAAVAETSYTASLAPSKTYYWRVRGENACGIGPYSTAFSFTILAVSCTTFASTDVPKLILEISTPSVMSTVGVATTGTVADVNVLNLAGTHTRVSDLDFNLISPASSAVQFFVPGCDDTDDFDIDLDDESDRAAGSWPCPPTDGLTYQPNSSLSVFDGEGSNGTWTLRVDDSVLFAGGSLDSWGLEICVLSCGQSDVILTDLTVADSQAHTACNSITVGPNVTVEATGRLDLSAPSIVLTNDVSILGEASLSAD
jgi:subtilisin-like proprotein convertase family protein